MEHIPSEPIMYPPNRIIRKHQQRASESRYLNHSTQCASVSHIRMQKGRPGAQPIAEHTHRPKMNFPIWGSPRPTLPPKIFPKRPSPITDTRPKKNSPAPASNRNLERHAEAYTQHRPRSRISSGRRGLLTVPRGKPWGGGGPSARRHRPVGPVAEAAAARSGSGEVGDLGV